jgi:tetratricopeptide (TPR) repeat protein
MGIKNTNNVISGVYMIENEVNEISLDDLNEAEGYCLKAQFVLNELQANRQVYGSNSAIMGAQPANVDLALEYIGRSLEINPENPIYLNLKALLLWEGKKDKDGAIELLKKAAEIDPRNIDIQNNLKVVSSSNCFIATAAYHSPMANDVVFLRSWRDEKLLTSFYGRLFVKFYYFVSPPIAKFISHSEHRKSYVRIIIKFVIKRINA